MAKRVSILPSITVKNVEVMEKILERRNHADYNAYLCLCRMVRYMDTADEEQNELILEANDIIEEREAANNEFMEFVRTCPRNNK